MSTQKQFQARSQIEDKDYKPLRRTQEFLKELKIVITLVRELLVEVKVLAFVVALIALLVWGTLQLFQGIHG